MLLNIGIEQSWQSFVSFPRDKRVDPRLGDPKSCFLAFRVVIASLRSRDTVTRARGSEVLDKLHKRALQLSFPLRNLATFASVFN